MAGQTVIMELSQGDRVQGRKLKILNFKKDSPFSVFIILILSVLRL